MLALLCITTWDNPPHVAWKDEHMFYDKIGLGNAISNCMLLNIWLRLTYIWLVEHIAIIQILSTLTQLMALLTTSIYATALAQACTPFSFQNHITHSHKNKELAHKACRGVLLVL